MVDAEQSQEGYFRLRTPKAGEIIGVITGRMGGTRFVVYCADKKERLCRVPGKIKHQVWVKEGDIVIVEPWPVESDKKGDIIWRYTRIQMHQLKKQGLLKDLPI
ncbi:MAG: translation initiation factor eIF-1A [Candidatus Micrarchaeia archaeon]